MPYKDLEKRRQYNVNYHRNRYASDASPQKAAVAARKQLVRDWLTGHKKKLQCARCPENDTVCLDFHHRDAEKKDISIARAVNRGWSIRRILREIEKCDVLCSNCHRKEHRDERDRMAAIV